MTWSFADNSFTSIDFNSFWGDDYIKMIQSGHIVINDDLMLYAAQDLKRKNNIITATKVNEGSYQTSTFNSSFKDVSFAYFLDDGFAFQDATELTIKTT